MTTKIITIHSYLSVSKSFVMCTIFFKVCDLLILNIMNRKSDKVIQDGASNGLSTGHDFLQVFHCKLQLWLCLQGSHSTGTMKFSDDTVIQNAFHKVMWQHFSDVVGRFITTSIKFLQDSVYQKLLKSVFFLTELLKNNRVTFFGPQCKHSPSC